MRAVSYIALIAMAAVLGFSAFAQQSGSGASAPPPSTSAPLLAQTAPISPPAVAPEMPVDETALRYFARQGDTVRVQTEIDRLRRLHPNWEPPTNLLSDDYGPDADVTQIWALFAAGDFAGARAAIATKQQNDPGFMPSEDLLQSLALGEAGLQLRNASDARQYQTVITLAANNPGLLVCDSVDNLWRLAEAFAQTGNPARASDAYLYVLGNCDDPANRFATLQKAMDQLDTAALEPLLALERTGADGQPEFASLRLDLARSAVAKALETEGATPSQADIDLLEQAATTTQNAEDLRLLGWYQLAQNRPNEGRRWFEKASEVDPSLESAQGLGVALIDLRDPEAAEIVLSDYRDDNDEIEALYLDAAAGLLALTPRVDLQSNVLGRIVDAVTTARAAGPAQELGWYAYDFQQPQTAAEWFALALRWQTDLEPAAYGLMVASNALGDAATVESIRTQWGARSQRIAQFGRVTGQSMAPPLPQPRPAHQTAYRAAPVSYAPVQPSPARASAQAPQGTSAQGSTGTRSCTGYVPAASLSASGALGHAWCLMQLNRPAQAVDHFARALQSGAQATRSDAAYGLSLAYIRLGLADEAAIAAAAAPITNKQAVELEIAILTEKATSAYDIGDYRRALDALDRRARFAPERNDLLTLRAWSYYHIRRFNEARRIFEAVAATGYGDAAAGLAATENALLQASY